MLDAVVFICSSNWLFCVYIRLRIDVTWNIIDTTTTTTTTNTIVTKDTGTLIC